MLHYLRGLVLFSSLFTAHAAIAATSGEHAHHHSGHDHTRLDALVGINFVAPAMQSLRLAAEAGAPIYQDLNGPQLETDLVFTLGAQFTF